MFSHSSSPFTFTFTFPLLLAGAFAVAHAAEGRPAPPAALRGQAGSASHIDLQWTDASDSETGFLIQRSLASKEPPAWEPIGSAPANATRFQSVGLLARTSYRHRICSHSAKGQSDWVILDPIETPEAFPGPRGRVIVPSSDEFPRNGEGSFVVLAGGVLAYYYGAWPSAGDDARGTRIARITSKDDGDTWTPPAVVLKEDGQDLYHPCLARLANGAVGLAYTKRRSGTKLAEKVFRSSRDEGATWSDEVPISDGKWKRYITGAHDRLVRLESGRLIVPVFMAMLNSSVVVGGKPVAASLVFASDDHGLTWQRKTPSPQFIAEGSGDRNCEEPCVVEWRKGQLLMVHRTLRGWLYESRSTDNGETWSPPTRSTVANPRAPARLERIPGSGHILMIHNPHTSGRDWHKGARLVLASQTSPDGGLTWEHYRQLEYDGKTWYDYPSVFWVGDTLHVAYRATAGALGTSRTDVRYLKLKRDWLVEH